jgi:hypothetical protein
VCVWIKEARAVRMVLSVSMGVRVALGLGGKVMLGKKNFFVFLQITMLFKRRFKC